MTYGTFLIFLFSGEKFQLIFYMIYSKDVVLTLKKILGIFETD